MLGIHDAVVNSINFSSKDDYLISCSQDKQCIVWNMKWARKGEKMLYINRVK